MISETEIVRPIPDEIKKWNWGAFLLNWVWGLGNNTYIALLMLVPFVGLIMPFYLGFKGNELAWKNKQWNSLEEFKQSQKNWATAGIAVVILVILLSFGMVFGIMSSFRNMEVVDQALEMVNSNNEVVEYLGKPITKGYLISGNAQISGPSGNANLAVPIKGSKGEGVMYLEAIKDMGEWKIQRMIVEIEKNKKRIEMVGQS